MTKIIRRNLWILLVLSTGCSSTQEQPSTYGSGTDDLKRSPCADCTLEPFYIDGRWLEAPSDRV